MPNVFHFSSRQNPAWSVIFALLLTLSAALTLEAQERRVVSTSVSPGANPAATALGVGPAYHPSRVLVRFRTGAPPAFLPRSGPTRAFSNAPDLFLVANPPGLSVAEAILRYRGNANVLSAEPDYVVQVIHTPTDPLWNQQWDMVKIAAPAAWDTQTNSSDVIVAVIDTGIDYTHPDLQANLWVNPADNSHGFTCINTCVAGGADDFGHGTHVAGTIGAAANNGNGIAGLNWQVQLLSLKFLDSNGSGYISDAVLCFDKVAELRRQGFNIRVTSNSWGGGGFSQALKDSMTQTEALGVVHVCAAGNSNQNADVYPMYPAAYDNRGIVSVGASDQADLGAGFTNYGLFNVDIMAPGVSTLSTVPITTPLWTCPLCDPTGYKLLSGTSMATPHVSGVLAAMFHKKPLLQTNEARDVILDPASYDAVTDPKAQSTSTGGRLNFTKAISNPLLDSPKLNNFPTITMGPNVFASAGNQVNLTASTSDPDNDPLRMAWTRQADIGNQWLFGWALNTLFPVPTTNPVSFTAPSLARTATVPYDASVADGRGGGAHGRDYVTVLPAQNPGQPPSGTLAVNPTDAPAGSTITVNFPATDPEGSEVAWDLWIGMQYGASGTCCMTGSSTSFTLSEPGVYRVGAQAIDKELNLSTRPSAVVRIGGATGEPPIASATLDKLSGPVPLTVNIDMSASSDQDGVIQYYFFNCGGGSFTPGSQNSKGSCIFDTPGPYWIILQAQDSSGYIDLISAYAVATPNPDVAPPPPPPPPPPPTPQLTITSPADGSTVARKSAITIGASVTPSTYSVGRVDFLVASSVVCSDTSVPYSCKWKVPATANKTYQISANAYDTKGQLVLPSNKVSVTAK